MECEVKKDMPRRVIRTTRVVPATLAQQVGNGTEKQAEEGRGGCEEEDGVRIGSIKNEIQD